MCYILEDLPAVTTFLVEISMRAPDSFSSAIVAVGSFNPAIITPDWLEKNQLIGSDDAASARASQGLIISQQVTVYETDWFAIQVLDNQFTLQSKGALSPTFRDLASGIFSLVPHTPITALGLNFSGDYKVPTVDAYHKVGDMLAPKEIWSKIYPPDKYSLGMMTVTIRVQEGKREENFPVLKSPHYKNITVQPSNRVRSAIFLQLNDHRQISEIQSEMTSAELVAQIIAEEWEECWEHAQHEFGSIVDFALA